MWFRNFLCVPPPTGLDSFLFQNPGLTHLG
jgi:hypothetical protein